MRVTDIKTQDEVLCMSVTITTNETFCLSKEKNEKVDMRACHTLSVNLISWKMYKNLNKHG